MIRSIQVKHQSMKCSYCDRPWPRTKDKQYESCPTCREPTKPSISPPMPLTLAERLKAHFEFGWWLWDNDRV